ncbi:triose-phosphate isomerase [Buchnera aphidicola]|uniref:Triosephosphate isomerase n=1 Tax=Buchnera aphidicola (Cinara strobi) TaxID=1921549 RepID=A0A3B1E9H3_9GAMM|nr:triose-phosphate isomerase [Buchnera aphidicola]VAX76549.1 Triosephosphate isomerase [Buchnera aphidicola (Cinara strobi)]
MIKPIIIGNWKLNGNTKLIRNFFKPLNLFLESYSNNCTTIIAPPILYANIIQNCIPLDKKNFFLGAQNIDCHLSGSFTGEISSLMIKDIKIKYVIIGHSERRFYHNETNAMIAKKFCILKEQNLIPILCIGDTIKEKEENKTKEVCIQQIDTIFNMNPYKTNIFDNSIIAYEPLWAIGSGRAANPKSVQSIIHFIRNYIIKKSDHKIKNLFMQYGGSINKKNAKEFIYQKDIDGLLIGGASLKIKEFTKIIEIINT